MNMSKAFQETLEKALREVERGLSLPGNSLVDLTPLPIIHGPVKSPLLDGKVELNVNFLAHVEDRYIRHRTELMLRKRIAQQNEVIDELFSNLASFLEQ